MVERTRWSRDRAERLADMAEQARAQADADEKLLKDMAGVLGIDPQLRLDGLHERLRGERLREVAIAVLSERENPHEPIHYKDWYEMLRERGYDATGKDPLATFLAQVRRTNDVEPVGRRSGLYLLRAA